ncbi:MAG: oligopeptide transporter, OPT family, partial [Terriglobales bacterium]
FAVGAYLSIGTTLAIFCGGIIRWLVERGSTASASDHDSEVSPGSLYASGLIAAGGIVGLMGIGLKLWEAQGGPKDPLKFGGAMSFLHHDWVSVLMFMVLGYSLFHFARKPLETAGEEKK